VGRERRSLGADRVKVAELKPGLELGPSSWIDITQERVDAFADATDDHQWIHVDPERARQGPFGTTIAHGYLTLSLVVPISYELMTFEDVRMGINYGANRVRFPAPVPVGSRIRGRMTVQSVEEAQGGIRVTSLAELEREAGDKPVCVAEVVSLLFT
jgi:acyl dehydratase